MFHICVSNIGLCLDSGVKIISKEMKIKKKIIHFILHGRQLLKFCTKPLKRVDTFSSTQGLSKPNPR